MGISKIDISLVPMCSRAKYRFGSFCKKVYLAMQEYTICRGEGVSTHDLFYTPILISPLFWNNIHSPFFPNLLQARTELVMETEA